MSDLTGLSNYTDYMTDANRVATENLQKELEQSAKTKENEALFDACKQFEAYLWEQVYKEMQKSVDLFAKMMTATPPIWLISLKILSFRKFHSKPLLRVLIPWRKCYMNRRNATTIFDSSYRECDGLL